MALVPLIWRFVNALDTQNFAQNYTILYQINAIHLGRCGFLTNAEYHTGNAI